MLVQVFKLSSSDIRAGLLSLCARVMFPHYPLACPQLCTSWLLIHKDGFFPNELGQNVCRDPGNCDIILRHSCPPPPSSAQALLKKGYTQESGWSPVVGGGIMKNRQISTCCCSWQAERAGLAPSGWCPSGSPPPKASSSLVCWGFGSGPWTNPGRHRQDVEKDKSSQWVGSSPHRWVEKQQQSCTQQFTHALTHRRLLSWGTNPLF